MSRVRDCLLHLQHLWPTRDPSSNRKGVQQIQLMSTPVSTRRSFGWSVLKHLPGSQVTEPSFICWGSPTQGLGLSDGPKSVWNDRSTLGGSLFWPCRDRTQSEIWTLNLYILLCDPMQQVLIFFCSHLTADRDENKLWPTLTTTFAHLVPKESGSATVRQNREVRSMNGKHTNM